MIRWRDVASIPRFSSGHQILCTSERPRTDLVVSSCSIPDMLVSRSLPHAHCAIPDALGDGEGDGDVDGDGDPEGDPDGDDEPEGDGEGVGEGGAAAAGGRSCP